MIAVDANVLVRIVIDDPGAPDQCAAARAAVEAEVAIQVPQVVQAELAWVLTRAFRFSRAEVGATMLHLRDNTAFHLDDPDSFAAALLDFEETSVGFADCLILVRSRRAGASLLTFDKKLARLPGAQEVR